MKNFDLAKKICKEHGVKGFRKLKLKRVRYIAGKQCAFLNKHIAERLINRLIEEGFEVDDMITSYELADKGLLDCITLS